ncbi:4-hydroxy-tetrahydrodipicolinate reductase [Sphingomonas rubra]|uniref:4-hydroxy-tetrahydrodipicolinate reductase n=1 Tax=Sphingomonas rubra TaxID=634430 RepID=A0A1I5UB49_9SPHN|nr:4-hydroxy-tetrahydrodipicolinate reductase [Sphingomonas rubra]SFP92510.1 dihydrodipicolinate reductase [Sphingomonas rubra]
MTSIGILGGDGRMGRSIAAAAAAAGVPVAGTVDRGGDAVALARAADVLIDFSAAGAVEAHLAAARAARTPLLIGTTGLSPEQHRAIDAAAGDVAVLQTGNTSLGVTLLATLVREAAARLGEGWDVEIVEMHHRHKADAPSGTALLLGEAAAAGRGRPLDDIRVDAHAGVRADGAIGFASLRGGSVVGDHRVILAGEGERIELAHVAEDRGLFARGAVKAALWLAGQPAGRYTMRDVLGL